MTHKQAIKESLKVKWKIINCGRKGCWCRGVTTEKPILFGKNEEINIIPTGAINKTQARYIVKLHNKSL